MIIDKIENISIYKNIPEIARDFILSLKKETPSLGKHVLSESIYANVETYETKLLENGKFEALKDYIDVQILLKGHEQIFIAPQNSLTMSEPYDAKRDIEFYSDNIRSFQSIKLDGTNFVMLFPHEAHAPQVSIDEKLENVLKVVVKIKI